LTGVEFTISASQVLDPSGYPIEILPPFVRDAGELVSLYRVMVLTRTFDAKAIALQRTGRLGTSDLLNLCLVAWPGSRHCRRRGSHEA
jgi:2-oxoisovalerate dehydrogenase E1 component alpha subunit